MNLFLEEEKEVLDSSQETNVEDTSTKEVLESSQETNVEETSTTKESTTEATPTKEIVADKKKAESKPTRKPGSKKLSINRTQQRRQGRFPTEFEEKVVDIARVTTVVKGGRRFSFSALVVVGNKKGKVGYGHGKANEVPDAIRKAIKDAKRNLINVPIIDKRTVPHDQLGKFLSSKILLKPAPKGKGIIASGSVRAVVELAGYKDIYTKSLGSRSKTNTVKATIKALESLRTAKEIATLRDINVKELVG
ncbi:MAG: 30S ribosomal protein S5 [Tenericutes bacterium]|nr:MAG: 30S ribosomal protein S5 [Mycoplasmatota bacterium]